MNFHKHVVLSDLRNLQFLVPFQGVEAVGTLPVDDPALNSLRNGHDAANVYLEIKEAMVGLQET